MHYLDRHSVRLKDHNYNDGVYFVTICTADRLCLFGDITNGVMHLNTLGEFAAQNLRSISEHNPYAVCPLFVVMPNHIHAIFFIKACNISNTQGESGFAPTENTNISPRRGSLSVVVRGFKIAVTRFANLQEIGFEWQRSFHEHLVRDSQELDRIVEYIENNPANWETDEYRK